MTGDNVPQYCTSFEETPLRPLLLENIRASGYTKPTPVQRGAIPSILLRRDVMACAQTGSGKTVLHWKSAAPVCVESKTLLGLPVVRLLSPRASWRVRVIKFITSVVGPRSMTRFTSKRLDSSTLGFQRLHNRRSNKSGPDLDGSREWVTDNRKEL